MPIWKREWLTQHLLSYYHSFESVGIKYRILVLGSEGRRSKKTARGLEYLETDGRNTEHIIIPDGNDTEHCPLDKKYDDGFAYSQRFDPDMVALVGGDDFITKNYFEYASERISSGDDMVGILDCYLSDIVSNKLWYWPGYEGERKGDSIGAGRIYSKKILQEMKWKPFIEESYQSYNYDDERSENKVRNISGNIHTINMSNIGCRYWNVKANNSINKIEGFIWEDHVCTIPSENVTELPEHTRQLFYEDLGLPYEVFK